MFNFVMRHLMSQKFDVTEIDVCGNSLSPQGAVTCHSTVCTFSGAGHRLELVACLPLSIVCSSAAPCSATTRHNVTAGKNFIKATIILHA